MPYEQPDTEFFKICIPKPTKNQTGKPGEMDLPLLQNDIKIFGPLLFKEFWQKAQALSCWSNRLRSAKEDQLSLPST